MNLQGKLSLYAKRDCADQLRRLRNVSIEILRQGLNDDLYSVHVQATDGKGRKDEDLGVVPLPANVKGEFRANMMLKAVTKAKRRVTLSICGLGFLDETEVRDVAREEPPPKTIRSISEGLNNVVGKAKSERGKAKREQLKAAGLDDEDIEDVLEDMGELEDSEFDEPHEKGG